MALFLVKQWLLVTIQCKAPKHSTELEKEEPWEHPRNHCLRERDKFKWKFNDKNGNYDKTRRMAHMLSAEEFTKAEVTKLSCSKTAVAFQVVQWERICLQYRRHKSHVFSLWVRKIHRPPPPPQLPSPTLEEGMTTLVILPGESYGGDLAGYIP